VSGRVIVHASGPFSHQGVSLLLDGRIQFNCNTQKTGVLDALSVGIDAKTLIHLEIPVAGAGKILREGITEFVFELPLRGREVHTLPRFF
jgi:hypothetical protein